MQEPTNRRILLIDDMPSMHRDFRQTLASLAVPPGLDQLESELFGLMVDTSSHTVGFEVDSAYQGHDGLAQVAAAVQEGRPYALAFVDMRMPPGWDGVETIERLWRVDPQLQIVVCTAYSDHPWEEVLRRLDVKDRLLIIKKPFDMIEVAQLARTLTAKWTLARDMEKRIGDLEAAVQARTRELGGAKDTAESANRAKAEFLSNMSREIRTPITAMMGLSYLLLQSDLTQLQRDQLSRMHTSGDDLMAILNDILDFSKVESGKIVLESTIFTPGCVLKLIEAPLSEQCAAKGLNLSVLVGPDVPAQLRGDPTRLAQVLLNFSSNAIKFTQGDGVVVSITVQSRTEHEVVLRFAVKDTGTPMTDEQQRLAIQAFRQADPSTASVLGATGLGLAVSQKLAELMGGEVGAENRPGHSSSYWFTARIGLPLPAQPGGGPGAPTEPCGGCGNAVKAPHQGDAADVERPVGRARVLMVEDAEINQMIGCAFLEKVGVDVDVLNDGHAVIERLSGHSYDLVLMDVYMPVLDGMAATRLIRNQAEYQHLPVIAMTASAMPVDRQRCLDAGMNDFLPKPLDFNAVRQVLEKWLPGRLSPAAARARETV